MEMDMRRIMLRAALMKLIEGISIPESVSTCCESMISIFAEVDDIRHLEQRSRGTDWARKALERVNLAQLGNFTVQVATNKGSRTIMFVDGDTAIAIEFVFEYTPRKAVDRLQSSIERARGQSEAGQKAVIDAFLHSVVRESLLGKSESPEKLLLGDKPLALDEYLLWCVRLVKPLDGLLKYLPFRQRKVLHLASS